MFTSPISGTHVFYVSAVEYITEYLRLDIVLKSVTKVRALGEHSAGYQTGTNMVVLNLQKRENVWVRHSHGKGFYTKSVQMTAFSGFLIE